MDYVDISVAVATKKGLVTLVVRNIETIDLVGIEKAITDLGKKVIALFIARCAF
jgi:2-oxoglutarate dehydrogenase E2 component (dihydrolipoamide succinyltransferase)